MASFTPGVSVSESYYSLLSVEPHATPDEIRKAYRKLALRFHPDKNPDAGETFQKISTAYATLSDPQRRQVYDRFGEQGVQIMEQAAAYGVPPWLLNPAAQSGLLCVLLVVVMGLVVVFPVILTMRIDGGLAWPWPAVFTPLWLADLLVLALAAASPRDRDAGCWRCVPNRRQVNLALLIAFQLLLAYKLDAGEQAPFTYSESFLPLEISIFLGAVAELCMHGRTALGRGRGGGQGAEGTDRAAARRRLVSVVARSSLQLSFLGLLGCRADNLLPVTWWAVLTPLWLLLLLCCLRAAASCASIKAAAQEEERVARRVLAGLSSAASLICFLCLLLLSLRLAEGVPLSAALILTPFLTVIGLLLCCTCTSCICAGILVSADADGAADGVAAGDAYQRHCDEESAQSDPSAASASGVPPAAAAPRGGPAGGAGGRKAFSADPAAVPLRASAEEERLDEVSIGIDDVVDLGHTLRSGGGERGGEDAGPSEEELREMGIRALKQEMARRGLRHTHLLEKSELLAALGARPAEPAEPAAASQFSPVSPLHLMD
mmetsp:Transcript_33995/g.109158  ORF Transcript_33995/g.109158 Transcript_33995/m.109158 type:complete len:548 (+) Transcript_33995:37-1680(+)